MAIPSVNKKTTLFVAAVVVVLLGIMIYINRVRLSYFFKPNYQTEIKQIEQQSNSTDLDSIEKDLNDTDVKNIDKEMNDIQYEIDQVYN